MDKKFAEKLIKKTIDDYNRIAPLWSIKRSFKPSDMIEIANLIGDNEKILDLGCANGIFYNIIRDRKVKYTGTDVAEELLNIARNNFPDGNFIKCDPLSQPFLDNSFDKVVCLSVFHHLPGREARLSFLREIRRILKEKGILLLTVWQINEEMREWWSQNKTNYKDKNLEAGDIYYPFKDSAGNVQANRYVHGFDQEELADLLVSSGFTVNDSRIIERGRGRFSNVLSIAQK